MNLILETYMTVIEMNVRTPNYCTSHINVAIILVI